MHYTEEGCLAQNLGILQPLLDRWRVAARTCWPVALTAYVGMENGDDWLFGTFIAP